MSFAQKQNLCQNVTIISYKDIFSKNKIQIFLNNLTTVRYIISRKSIFNTYFNDALKEPWLLASYRLRRSFNLAASLKRS